MGYEIFMGAYGRFVGVDEGHFGIWRYLEMVGSLLKIELPQSTSRTPTFPHFHGLTRCFCQVLKDCATLWPESLDPPRG